MTKFRSIFWHRRDLRIEDNIGLFEASKNSKKLIGVYVLDPNLLDLKRTTSEAKNWFLGESLLELQKKPLCLMVHIHPLVHRPTHQQFLSLNF